jgi:hypothetical protein
MENLNGVADTISEWIVNEMKRRAGEESILDRQWREKTGYDRQRMDEKWLSEMRRCKEGTDTSKMSKL